MYSALCISVNRDVVRLNSFSTRRVSLSVNVSSTFEMSVSDAAALMMSFTRWSYSTSTSSVNRRITLASLLPNIGTLDNNNV